MAKALVIAEKPSLGRSIVSAISWWKNEKFTRQGKDRNTWLESDNYIVASSVGHLYELIDLDAYFPDYDPEKRHPWTMARLPFFPDDLICMSAGVTDMKFGFFALSTAIARTAYIFTVSFLGNGDIIPFGGWGIAVWAGIFVVCVILSATVGKIASAKDCKKTE